MDAVCEDEKGNELAWDDLSRRLGLRREPATSVEDEKPITLISASDEEAAKIVAFFEEEAKREKALAEDPRKGLGLTADGHMPEGPKSTRRGRKRG